MIESARIARLIENSVCLQIDPGPTPTCYQTFQERQDEQNQRIRVHRYFPNTFAKIQGIWTERLHIRIASLHFCARKLPSQRHAKLKIDSAKSRFRDRQPMANGNQQEKLNEIPRPTARTR